MKTHRASVVVVGGGFAGLQAALAARRIAGPGMSIAILSPDPHLVLRPRLYEANPDAMQVDVRPTLLATGIDWIPGEAIDVDLPTSTVVLRAGDRVGFDRLVVATGSEMVRPAIPGFSLAFNIDRIAEAVRFDRRLDEIVRRGRARVAIVGGGFVGLELALELRRRVRERHGEIAAGRLEIALIDRSPVMGATLGDQLRPIIERALDAGGVQRYLGESVAWIETAGVRLSRGGWVPADAVVLCLGLRAASFTHSLPFDRAADGRLIVDACLRPSTGSPVFAAGDAARAEAAPGQPTLMSCQHALGSGPVAGENAARDLIGMPLIPYSQPDYVTCLDLGDFGAVFSKGWDRTPVLVGADAKALKHEINTKWIYPPRGTPTEILAGRANARRHATARASASPPGWEDSPARGFSPASR